MSTRAWLFEVPGESEVDLPSNFAEISQIRLSQLAKRNIAIEIHSEVLGCSFWLCSNDAMVSKLKEDYTEAITYTVDEIRELLRLNPKPEDLKRIHDIKSVFNGSKIVDSKTIREIPKVLE